MFNAAQIELMEKMKDFYHNTSFTQTYMVGWIEGYDILTVTMEWDEFKKLLKYDRAATSKGGMLKIRVKLDKKAKTILKSKAIVVGKIEELTFDKKHNKGENFERIVTEKLAGCKWQKDSIPYYKAGDIILNGKPVQVKFDGAELTNQKTYENLKELLQR